LSTAKSNFGDTIRQRRLMSGLTTRQLSIKSGVSSSHLHRVERGERFPSAGILRKLAPALGISESELFTMAGFLSPQPSGGSEDLAAVPSRRLDPYVASVLSQESPEIQRTVLTIISTLKFLAKNID